MQKILIVAFLAFFLALFVGAALSFVGLAMGESAPSIVLACTKFFFSLK